MLLLVKRIRNLKTSVTRKQFNICLPFTLKLVQEIFYRIFHAVKHFAQPKIMHKTFLEYGILLSLSVTPFVLTIGTKYFLQNMIFCKLFL